MPKIENSLESIELLMDKMLEKGINSVFLKDDDFEIKIVASAEKSSSFVSAIPAQTQSSVAPVEKSKPDGNVVKSPVVGTFYSSPSPNDKAFVTVGQSVKKGDVIFIVESMKVMSEVQSEYDGVVSEICVVDGDTLEFDQIVMIIK